MKIAILTPLRQEEAETFIQNHILNLPFEKVVIYGGSFPYLSNHYQPTVTQRIRFKIIQFLKNKLGYKQQKFESYHLATILKKEKVDVVFAEYLITGAEAMDVCKRLKIPLIAIALGYDISVQHIIDNYKEKYKALFNYASKILVVSEHMKVNLKALNCQAEKIVFSPAAPDKHFFNVTPLFNKKQLLAVGRFVDKKAPHLTIMAFQKVLLKMPDAKLVMAGDGPLLNACKDLAKALKVENSIKFIGRISPEQHRELLAESMVFVQHSKVADNGDSEGTPVAILEASAAGLPIVSTFHAGIPRVVLNNQTGFLVTENDVDTMAEKMVQLLQDSKTAKEFGNNGREYVMENFTLEKHIEAITTCIKEAI